MIIHKGTCKIKCIPYNTGAGLALIPTSSITTHSTLKGNVPRTSSKRPQSLRGPSLTTPHVRYAESDLIGFRGPNEVNGRVKIHQGFRVWESFFLLFFLLQMLVKSATRLYVEVCRESSNPVGTRLNSTSNQSCKVGEVEFVRETISSKDKYIIFFHI